MLWALIFAAADFSNVLLSSVLMGSRKSSLLIVCPLFIVQKYKIHFVPLYLLNHSRLDGTDLVQICP